MQCIYSYNFYVAMPVNIATVLCSRCGAAIRDFRFGAELWFSGFIYILWYGAESWKITKTKSHSLPEQMPRCRIHNIFWPNTTLNVQLRTRTPDSLGKETAEKIWRRIEREMK